jgi:hypothetical protein
MITCQISLWRPSKKQHDVGNRLHIFDTYLNKSRHAGLMDKFIFTLYLTHSVTLGLKQIDILCQGSYRRLLPELSITRKDCVAKWRCSYLQSSWCIYLLLSYKSLYVWNICVSRGVLSKEKQKTSWNVNCFVNRVVSALVNLDLRRSICIYFAVKLTLVKIHADVLSSRTYPATSRTASVYYVKWRESVNKSRQTLMSAFMRRCVENPLVP